MSIRLTLDADLFPNRHRLDTHIVWAHNRLPNEMSQNMFGWSCSLPLYAATKDVLCSRTLQHLSINTADALNITSYVLCGGSLMTMTISVDRLVIGAEIQANCNFEVSAYHFSYHWALFSVAALYYFIHA